MPDSLVESTPDKINEFFPVAHVIPLVPVPGPFTYLVPPELDEVVQRGTAVLVPFGKRTITGIVLGRDRKAGRFKDIIDVLDEEQVVTDELIRLAEWMAEYYVCFPGEVFRMMLPTGLERTSRRVFTRTEVPVPPFHGEAHWLEWLEEHPESTLRRLERESNGQVDTSVLRRWRQAGWISEKLIISSGSASTKTAIHVKHVTNDEETPTDALVRQLETLKGEKQKRLLEKLVESGRLGEKEPSRSALLSRAGASSGSLAALERLGYVIFTEKEVIRTPYGDVSTGDLSKPEITFHPGQTAAIEAVTPALETGEFRTFLLHGITGSGKTEVYMAALQRTLEAGRTGIVLVPEIALTPQTVRRFRSQFGDQVAVLHSRMSAGERYDSWRMLRSGRYSIAIGPRSAVLAPLKRLGLIIVDEEHEGSYKQFDPAPRYHARDVAVMRASMNDAVCVLGSATPSIESYVNAETGKYTLLRMPKRVPVHGRAAASLPRVEVVDLSLERKRHQLEGVLSSELRTAIRDRLDKKEQIILLQNRRGYASLIECKSCGWTPECHSCDVTMTLHKTRRALLCHYCGERQRVPARCLACGETDIGQVGVGTQRVEEELASVFPDASVLRMDVDTTGRKDAHNRILSAFGRGEADILVGTQMVAKGLDFEKVTLVGVVNADTGLLIPDFRSSERTFQLLTQVAGRSGRGDLPGLVIFQTRNADNAVLKFARNHDYLGFLEMELPQRKTHGYPPFGKMAVIEFRGPAENQLEQMAVAWTRLLEPFSARFIVSGPHPAFISRIKKTYRYQTFIRTSKMTSGKSMREAIRKTEKKFGRPPLGYRIVVNIDPGGLS